MPDTRTGPGARLPAPYRHSILDSWAGPLILRPWFDRLALAAIARWFFPLSRAWAAAASPETEGEGGVERFLAMTYGPDAAPGAALRHRAACFVARVQTRRRAYEAAERAWEAAYFGPAAPSARALVAAQIARREAARHFMAARAAGVRLHLARRFPPLRFEVAPPEALEAAHGARLRRSGAAFAPPVMPDVEESQPVPTAQGRDHWLRFAAPVSGDTAWARVSTPATWGGGRAPSLIFLHGIAMETEFWPGLIDPSLPLEARGVRSIRPEGPGHGRRRPDGWFGGETAMARGPLGFIELFRAWVAEVAVLIAWARRTAGGPVAVGGVSLGALTAQMVAAAAPDWPAELRPDALFLVATGGDLVEATARGSLSGALGVPARLRAAGWSLEELTRWAPLLQPQGDPSVDPAKIVMVLGRSDDLLPYASGLALARRWAVPSDNLFTRAQGHFSVSLGLGPAPAPLARLAALLGA